MAPLTMSVLRVAMVCSHAYRASPFITSNDRRGRCTLTRRPCWTNSMQMSDPRLRLAMLSSKAECVSTCGGMPFPGMYSLTVSWSGTHRISLGSLCSADHVPLACAAVANSGTDVYTGLAVVPTVPAAGLTRAVQFCDNGVQAGFVCFAALAPYGA